MRIALALLLGATLAAISPHRASAPRSSEPRPLLVVVLAGQSNALGYDSFVIDPKSGRDVFTDASRSPADTRVLLSWDETGVASTAAPVPLDTPQVRSGSTTPIFGPEVGLGRELYRKGHHHLLIVKVAIDGSSLAGDWLPGDADFGLLLKQVDQSLEWARANGWQPTLGALYWFQGETDAESASDAASYAANLHDFLKAARSALGLGSHGVVVLAQIDLTDYIRFEEALHLCETASCSAEWQWNRAVMRAQAGAAGRHTFVVPTSRLSRFELLLHLTDSAELTVGKRFALDSAAQLP